MNDNFDDNKYCVDNVVVVVSVVVAVVVVDDVAAVELMQKIRNYKLGNIKLAVLKLVAIKWKEKVKKRMGGGE
uniref:Uncharacterized protein n=1 Tax=Wuchereria bancrofti TaxID=6293 RepID=A0AAF5PNU3_WUCBA